MKKYLAFTDKVITGIQLVALLGSVIGAFFVSWSVLWVFVALFFYYLYSAVGVSMMMHRYWSHKSFQFKNKFVRWVFTAIAVVTSRGSPIAWVHIHREHHAYSDTDKDPHRPERFSFFSFKTTNIKELKIFLIKDLMTKEQKLIHEYYLLFIILWCVTLLLISPYLFYFAWLLPVCLNQFAQDMWNYYSHVDVGYRNSETKDNSRNVSWLWFFVLGEAWHNNHHSDPKSVTTKVKSWESDPISHLIKLVRD